MEAKICQVCKEPKSLSEFWRNKAEKDGLQRKCKSCCRAYRAKNKDHLKQYLVEYNQKNFEALALKKKEYVLKDPEKRARYYAEYDRENRERKRPLQRENSRRRRATDADFVLRGRLISRLNRAVKRCFKAGSAVRDLGCSIPDFRAHISSKFQEGMTWENWGKGKGKWNIDHIMPLDAFDLTNRQHIVLACHYLNLQPLWAEENSSKGCKVDF